MEPRKYQYIDSLRGIAIMLVILAHIHFCFTITTSYFPALLIKFIQNGIFGVTLFFVVSSFTLVMSHQSRMNERHATRNFFIRRFFRIAPMFYLAIIYFTFNSFLGFDLSHLHFEKFSSFGFFSSLFFVNGFFPKWINHYVPGGWSVATEFMFYFTLPFLCNRIKNLNSSLRFLTIIVVISTFLAAFIIPRLAHNWDFVYYNFTSQIPVFALGIVLFWLLNDKSQHIKNSTFILIALAIFFFSYISIQYHFLQGLLFVLLIFIQNRKNYKLLSNKILATIGKVSFSMYLVHFAIIDWFLKYKFTHISDIHNFKSAALNFCVMYLLILSLTFAVSYLTHRFIELPGQKLGKLIINRLNKKEALAVI